MYAFFQPRASVACCVAHYAQKCDDFDEVAENTAKECKMADLAGPTWMEDATDDLCANIFGDQESGPTSCTRLAQERLLGYPLKCLLSPERMESMKDGGLMYKNADPMTSGLVNLFFFECKKEHTGRVWLQDPEYVKPYQPGKKSAKGYLAEDGDDVRRRQLDEDEEDLSKDADDEPGSDWKMTPSKEEEGETTAEGGEDASARGEKRRSEKGRMLDEDFKMRYDLGELKDDELLELDDEDLAAYLQSGKFKDEL